MLLFAMNAGQCMRSVTPLNLGLQITQVQAEDPSYGKSRALRNREVPGLITTG